MELESNAEPAFRDLASQLAIAHLKRSVPRRLIHWGPRLNGAGPSCPSCNKQCVALLLNPDCGHAACETCWVEWAESQIGQCRIECRLYPSCLHCACNAGMNPTLWDHICSESVPSCTYDHELNSERARLMRIAHVAFAQSPQLARPGPVCDFCQERRIVLLKNDACGHIACENCWSKHTELQLGHCRSAFKTRASCFHHNCSHPLSETIWKHISTVSHTIGHFSKEMDLEMRRLKARAGSALVMATCPSDPGPHCSICGIQQLALFQNTPCHHIACENCWAGFAEKQIPKCKSLFRTRPFCFDPLCQHAMSEELWEHSRTRSLAISEFADECDKEVQRLLNTAGELVSWAPSPCDAGPVCIVCNERHLALLRNTECGHTACENCWSRWVEVQLPRCHDAKQVAVRCLGAKCQTMAAAAIWVHACTLSDEVSILELKFARRRQLQNNVLYPSVVQVDCPQEGCLGLGYRGFDTVMCFMCEHQWLEDSGNHPETNESDIIAGELMKKCPACGEYIIKNGGCDHMTCRCKHEFSWTTLKPYRR